MNVVFAGGGTGGHLYPAIAIADALRDMRDALITFVGTADRLEVTIVPQAGYPLKTVASRPLVRTFSLDLLVTALANQRGIVQSLRALRELKTDVVIASGGYVCFPVVLAARLLRKPIALLEPNARPGLTNRLLAPLVDEVWGAYEEPDRRFAGKYVRTGIPVRESLRALPAREDALARFELSAARPTLLAIGGSQGAQSINDALLALLKADELPLGWQLIHATGERDFERIRAEVGFPAGYAVRPYVHEMADAYAAADVVIGRAGASTLGELAAVGKPAVLVPYPHATDDHQTRNAEEYAKTGAALVVADRDLPGGALRGALADATSPERLATMRAAAERLRASDPVTTILARIDALVERKTLR